MGNALYRFTSAGATTRVRNIRHKDTAFIRDRSMWWNKYAIQTWAGYPPTPEIYDTFPPYKTSDYPYQLIVYFTTDPTHYTFILLSNSKIHVDTVGFKIKNAGTDSFFRYLLSVDYGPNWRDWDTLDEYSYLGFTFAEANYDVYDDATLTGVYFAKTTTGPSTSWKRVNI